MQNKQRLKIYIIASVSSLFIGVSVFLLVSEQDAIAMFAIPMGIGAALGGMMIELTVPETLVAVWNRSSAWYKSLAVVATIASPALLIWALPAHGIARFSIAFIVASLITYLAYYASVQIKEQQAIDDEAKRIEDTNQKEVERIRLDAELANEKMRLRAEYKLSLEKMKEQENRKTKKVLAKVQGASAQPLTRDNVIELIRNESGISQRELGRRFDKAPQTVLNMIEAEIATGAISANGDGVKFSE